jgi:DNA-binding CsgD family transcriptional regulator
LRRDAAFLLLSAAWPDIVPGVQLVERAHASAAVSARADLALGGEGQLLVVTGESGAGKTAFVEQFVAERTGVRRLSAVCDPLDTPRPLGPIRDIAESLTGDSRRMLADAEHPYDIFDAVLADLSAEPTILVIDDLHWADQGTIDMLRFVLRRIHRQPLLVVGMARDEEVGVAHPLRMLLADIARSGGAHVVPLQPLSIAGVRELAGDRAIDPDWLHQITGGNAFFVTEMLDHSGGDLPTTVRDAVLGRTVGLDESEWDVLNLLSCSPEAIPDYLLADLGVALAPLQKLRDAHLIRQTSRGVAFRHDLCRLAVASVLPPGAEPALHLRMMSAYDAAGRTDPAVITHHALGAGDQRRIRQAAIEAGKTSARTGAHRQAAEFYRIAMESGGEFSAEAEAELLELIAAEYYLTDQLDNAIDACQRALRVRKLTGATAELSADHHSLAVYDWYNADRRGADEHAAHAVSAVGGDTESLSSTALASLGHAFAMQAYLAMQSSDLRHAESVLSHAKEIAAAAGDPALSVRVEIIEGICAVIAGATDGRDTVLELMRSAPRHLDEIYSSGYSNLTYLDVEQRRLTDAAELLNVTIPMTWERDLPICRVWQLGARGRLSLLSGDWDDALADASSVLDAPTAPLARTWPHLIRGLVTLRRGGEGADELDQAWTLARSYGEPIRLMPAAAALVERAWLTGTHDGDFSEYKRILDGASGPGLEWARGELTMWLRRVDAAADADGVAEPYRLYLDGDIAAAAAEFERLGTVYEAALALTEAGGETNARRGLDLLDRMGATAVADKVRLDLRATGMKGVPARRRTTTLRNPAGLTRRQLEVLQRMDDGLTNAELAAQLYLSAKTVDHHVSAILAKLDVANRRDAVRRGRALGIIA